MSISNRQVGRAAATFFLSEIAPRLSAATHWLKLAGVAQGMRSQWVAGRKPSFNCTWITLQAHPAKFGEGAL
jgi:hypothetical protein